MRCKASGPVLPRPSTFLRFGYIALYTGFLLLPLYWMSMYSLKSGEEYQTDPPTWWPKHPTFSHFGFALNDLGGRKGLDNSLVVAFATTILAVVIGTAAAYSMARFRTGGKHLAFWFLSQRLMPGIAVIIPIFLLYSRYSKEWLGISLVDTRIGLILIYTVFALPFTVWMMYAYFRQMPPELEEAALVDGCSRIQALWKIARPLATPGLVSAAAFAFIFAWTEFLFALVLGRTDAVTLPVVVGGIAASGQSSQYGEIAALSIVALIPAVLLGALVQKHIVRGLTLGAIQG